MKTLTVMVGTLFLSLFLSVQAAFPWGWAVHTYIDDQFATKWQIRNANQIYGGLAPDLFNFRFDAPIYQNYLLYQTHNDFMPVWNAAQSTTGKALAFGFVSHNEVWGIDSTAHRAGITFGQPGTIPGHPEAGGYVIAKAYLLAADPVLSAQFAALGLPEEVILAITHELVERGVDILMTSLDPTLGAKMAAAALPPNPNLLPLMQKTYGADLAAHFGLSKRAADQFLTSSERQFRQTLILYGQVLQQDTATAVSLMAEQLAEMAQVFLAAYGLPPLPEGVELKPLLEYGLSQAIGLCSTDFATEVFKTLEFVEDQLKAHGIAY